MSSLKDRAKNTNNEPMKYHAAALQIIEAYAGSGNANPKAIPELYKEIIRAFIEFHEGTTE